VFGPPDDKNDCQRRQSFLFETLSGNLLNSAPSDRIATKGRAKNPLRASGSKFMKRREIMPDIFERLKKLQQVDSQIDALKEKKANLPEWAKLEELRERLKDLQAKLTERESLLKTAELHQKKIEGELELISLKINGEEKKLYGGTISNPKELAGIQDEIRMLQKRRDEQETAFLEHLELVKGLQEEIRNLGEENEEIEQIIIETERSHREITEKIEGELQNLEGERNQIIADLDQNALSLYGEIRQKRGGLAVAELKEGICLGCGMELPAEEVDKILTSDQLWQCGHCRRILVR